MIRAKRALAVLVVASLGLWGCAQGPGNGTVTVERVRALETKSAKLEDDFRAAVTVRDQLKKKLVALEEQRQQMEKQVEQLQQAAREREELRQQLTARTGERDNVQTQFEQFRKNIRNLLGQVEAANTDVPAGPPVTAAPTQGPAGKS
jgi:septal ring factor EnvC (AmiA/AmiB activator)